MIKAYAFVLALLACGPALADDATPTAPAADPACVSPAEVAADIQAKTPPFLAVEQIADLSGDAAKPVVDAFNSLPPESEYQGDHVLVFHALLKATGQEHPQYVVAVFFKGCRQAVAMVPSSRFRALIGQSS